MSELEGLGALEVAAAPEQAVQNEQPHESHESQPENHLRAWAAQEFAPPESRLDMLPPDGADGSVKHPFRTIERESYLASIKGSGIARRSQTAPIALVNMSDLIAIQGTVNRERVGHHLDDPYLYAPGAKSQNSGMLVDRPVVVRKNGMLLIHDGHHRLTAHHLRGIATAKVRFIDLDTDPVA